MATTIFELDTIISTMKAPKSKEHREEAEKQLYLYANNFYQDFLLWASRCVTNEKEDSYKRKFLAVTLKNLISKSLASVSKGWEEDIDSIAKNEIRSILFQGLATPEKDVRNSVSSCIASICAIEFPKKQWLNILSELDMITSADIHNNFRLAAMVTIKSIMQDVEPETLDPQYISAVLYTIYKNLNSNESVEMRTECLDALVFTIVSVSFIMKDEEKKLSLMNMIFEAIQFPESALKIKAIQCLTESAKYFYEELDTSMNKILEITAHLISASNDQSVITQSYEFWLIICQTEAKLISNSIVSKNYIKCCEATLFNLCLNTIIRRDRNEESDPDTWYPFRAAYELLKKISKCCSESLIKTIIDKISEFISLDAKSRHTAMLLFASIVSSNWPLVTETIQGGLNEIICNVNDNDHSTRITTSHIMIAIAKHHTRNLNTFNLLDFFIKFIYDTMKSSVEKEITCNMIYCLNLIALDFELGKQDCKQYLFIYYLFSLIRKVCQTSN